MTKHFEPGAIVRQGTMKYRVLGQTGDRVYVWLQPIEPARQPVTGISKVYDLVKPFFEPGKTYTRHVDWSIHAQTRDADERFECTLVEQDGNGLPVAFGRYEALGLATGRRAPSTWITLRPYDFDSGPTWRREADSSDDL